MPDSNEWREKLHRVTYDSYQIIHILEIVFNLSHFEHKLEFILLEFYVTEQHKVARKCVFQFSSGRKILKVLRALIPTHSDLPN